MNERSTIDRGWFYVIEGDDSTVPSPIQAGDGRTLSRRLHGVPGRIDVQQSNASGTDVAALLRVAAAAGFGLEHCGQTDAQIHIELTEAVPPISSENGQLRIQTTWLTTQDSRHPLEAAVRTHLEQSGGPVAHAPAVQPIQSPPVARVLFFESMMNTDMPHNDKELSQGVLHMASSLSHLDTEVVLANVKMAIEGDERPVQGLDSLDEALNGGEIGLICITLLEGYFEGVTQLIQRIRDLGCRAHIAVGGVMPTLAPEHVAAHLPDVSFVCRGAGEYFLPRLAQCIGNHRFDEPWTPQQRQALLNMRGIIAIERSTNGPIGLISARSDLSVQVDDLDQVPLDLSHLQARHIEGGIELSTSRGCIYRCTFCSIIGREQYQARSAQSVFSVLKQYEARFHEIYGDEVPRNAYRLHISDDDFACDKSRAKAFFHALIDTPFRLSSCQVAIGDLCRKENGRIVGVDDRFLDSIRPELFADAERSVPDRDFVLDHRSRQWSSFLQIGVESYSDAELARLGKGYRVTHIRSVVAALAARGIHMDSYFILSNGDTTADDLLDSLFEVCRLKLRYPTHFHLRFPIVQRLFSVFTSANHRRQVRQGKTHIQRLRLHAQVPGYAEFDYPFVDGDEPQDPWVRAAVDTDFFTDEDRYIGSLTRLSACWTERLQQVENESERAQGERLLRRLDDARRRLILEYLSDARDQSRQPSPAFHQAEAIATATELMGDETHWLRPLSRHTSLEVPRLVVIPTWQCELRCRYCYIPKQDGRVMSLRTLDRAIDLLLSADHPEVILQFFGGEALVEPELVRHAIEAGQRRAQKRGKTLRFILSSNGYGLNPESLAWLAQSPVKLELSLDGDAHTQNRFRRALKKGQDSYELGIPHKVEWIRQSGLEHEVIMVVHPENVERMPDNFRHIANLGFERIQINFGLGYLWTKGQQQRFASGLNEIGQWLRQRWGNGQPTMLINLESKPMPMRLNGEITVDWDGTLYGGNAFLHETEHKSRFVIGHLDDHTNFMRHWLDAPDNDYLLKWSYPPDVTQNNLSVGGIMTSFTRWMQSQGVGPRQPSQSAK